MFTKWFAFQSKSVLVSIFTHIFSLVNEQGRANLPRSTHKGENSACFPLFPVSLWAVVLWCPSTLLAAGTF